MITMSRIDAPDLIYLSRSRLHRNRANLIQTLHTVAALTELGVATQLYLPPWHRRVGLDRRLCELGIETRPDIQAVQLLHRRWPLAAFAYLYRQRLCRTPAVYLRSEELSLTLAAFGIRHHLELHTLRALIHSERLEQLIEYHRQGVIEHLFPISATIKNRLIENGADEQRIHLSPSGVDLKAYQTIPPLDLDRVSNPRIIYLGRISYDRGLGLLTELSELDAGFVQLVGDCDDPVIENPRLCYRSAVPHREVPALYAESELVLLPYQPELEHADGISPMKLFESMAAGRAIIASDIPPIREVIRDGHNGLLVAPRNAAAWHQAVMRLRRQPKFARRIADQARRDAMAYSWTQRATGIARTLNLLPS